MVSWYLLKNVCQVSCLETNSTHWYNNSSGLKRLSYGYSLLEQEVTVVFTNLWPFVKILMGFLQQKIKRIDLYQFTLQDFTQESLKFTFSLSIVVLRRVGRLLGIIICISSLDSIVWFHNLILPLLIFFDQKRFSIVNVPKMYLHVIII